MIIPKIQFLVLAYERSEESLLLLQSLKENVELARDSYWITYLDNGSRNHDRILSWYQDGLIDQLILRKKNTGGSWGMVDLVNLCQSEYAFLIQNDQFLIQKINDNVITALISALDSSKIVDLAGFQAGAGKFSDRASFVKVSDYREWTKNLENYGPGYEGNHEDKDKNDHNEGKIQKLFEQNNWKVCGTNSIVFGNNGKWSIRQHEDGSVTKWSTDEKRLYLIRTPTKKMKSLNVDNQTWDKILSGSWKDGDIPENWKKDSFLYWK